MKDNILTEKHSIALIAIKLAKVVMEKKKINVRNVFKVKKKIYIFFRKIFIIRRVCLFL